MRTRRPAREPALPLRNCYWVIPGELLAGEYPGGESPEETRERLRLLLDAGIDCFVDLTMPGELEPYHAVLPLGVQYVRKPIPDHGIPAAREHMAGILDHVTQALRSRRRVYVHCRAGIGRTGTVIGCLLAERGLAGDDALDELNRLWKQCERAKLWTFIPETEEQIEYVRGWTPRAPVAREPVRARSGKGPGQLPTPARRAAAPTPHERFRGALIGLAIGDALAAAARGGQRVDPAAALGNDPKGASSGLSLGAWTDDTSMALCLAESLLECKGFDARDQVERYVRWQQQGYLSATGRCVGITSSTARALALARWRRQLFSGSHDPSQLDPEPLSRVAPAVMFFFSSLETAIQNACDAARTTCQSPRVLEACRVFAAALHRALSGQPKSRILPPEALAQTAPVARAGDTIGEVLQAVFWAFRTTDSFAECVLQVAGLEGSSDVAAAACGQLAGAHYGVAAIPAGWHNSLIQKELLESFADRLGARAGVLRPG